MGEFLIYSPSKTERGMIAGQMALLLRRQGIAQPPEEILRPELLERSAEDAPLWVLVCDVTVSGVLPILEQLRRQHRDYRLIALADGSVSPMTYIRPGIQPVALMLRPLGSELVRSTLEEVFRLLPREQQDHQDQELDCFTLEVRGHLQRIPFRDILYFEARNKKLFVHLPRREIPFAGTLEKLEEELPSGFLRVHKSFIINSDAVVQIQYGQNLVILAGDEEVPISRSYKPKVKAVFS